MGNFIHEINGLDVPLTLTINKNGGITGDSPVVAMRRPNTNPIQYLDFSDNVFKTAGWTTRQQALTEISAALSPGVYELVIVPNVIFSSDETVVIEFENSGANSLAASDQYTFITPIRDTILDDATRFSGADIATILADTNETQGKLPTNNIMGSAVKTDKDDEIDAIKAKTDNLPVDPASETNVNANEVKIDIIDVNVDTILVDTNEMQTKLPTNNIMGSAVKTDKDDEIDAIKTVTDRLPDGGSLNDLDVAVGSRATQTSVDAIQNNTRAVVVVQPVLKLPTSGSKNYKFYVRLFDTAGSPEDPDANSMNIRIETTAGVIVVATVAMTRTGIGQYEFIYTVNSTDLERPLVIFVEYNENSIAFQHVRTTEVKEFESTLDQIASDVNNILADTNETQGKLPTNNIMGSSDKDNHDTDIDAIKVVTDQLIAILATTDSNIAAILIDTADMQPRIINIEADTNETQLKLPLNNIMGSSVKTDKDDEIDSMKILIDLNLDDKVSLTAKPGDEMDLLVITKDDIVNRTWNKILSSKVGVETAGDIINVIRAFLTNNTSHDSDGKTRILKDGGASVLAVREDRNIQGTLLVRNDHSLTTPVERTEAIITP